MSECKQCGIDGYPGPPLLAGEFPMATVEEFINTDIETLLFSHGGDHYCYPCHCLVTNTCFQCSEVVDYLFREKRCKSGSYVCSKCNDRTNINHLAKCYANGCITIEELATEEWEMMKHEF